MGPHVSNEGPESSTLPPDPQPKAKAKPGKSKRDGPLQLQFLTATDPSQFKDEKTKQRVRSQAMRHYKNSKLDKRKKKGPETFEVASPAEKGLVLFQPKRPTALHEDLVDVTTDRTESHVLEEHLQDSQYLYSSTSAAWLGTNSSLERLAYTEDTDYHEYTSQSLSFRPRYYRSRSKSFTKVVQYEYSESHEDLQVRLLVGKLARSFNLGDGVDPFVVLPQFRNAELNSLFLIRNCMRAFSSDITIVKWLPAMLSHPYIMLSSTLLASTWLDMHEGYSGDSKRTSLVKAETISMINERLRSPDTNLDDATLMIILHLLAGEMWSCNERTLRIHESGVARFITSRGGIHRLDNAVVGEVAAAACYHCDIFCETDPLPFLQNWEPPEYALPNDTAAIPESPLFCPRPDLATIAKDPHCSQTTHDLLCDMRDLTNLFVTHNAKPDVITDIDLEETAFQGSPSADYDIKVTEIRERLASLPSAYTPGLPTSNDWVYEACRITALIYTASIIMRVPFSVAADPIQNPIVSDLSAFTKADASGHPHPTRLTEALYEVMERTDTSNIWDEMPGVLYWVSAVGAAAARTPAAINMTQQPRFLREAYPVWVRRCLIMFSTRTMIVLVFQHPLPVILAQQRLLRVQELIRVQSARRLVS